MGNGTYQRFALPTATAALALAAMTALAAYTPAPQSPLALNVGHPALTTIQPGVAAKNPPPIKA